MNWVMDNTKAIHHDKISSIKIPLKKVKGKSRIKRLKDSQLTKVLAHSFYESVNLKFPIP